MFPKIWRKSTLKKALRFMEPQSIDLTNITYFKLYFLSSLYIAVLSCVLSTVKILQKARPKVF